MNFPNVLYPLEWVVAWIMVGWHSLFTALGLPAESGVTWVFSIVGLVLVIRSALIPLFVRQIRSSRQMQLLQPEIKKIQDRYKGKTDPESRQALARETMELYKTNGTSPFSSCLPLLLQMPIFFALFRVLNGLSRPEFQLGPITPALRSQAEQARIFGSQLSDTFLSTDLLSTRVLAVVMVGLMTASQYWTQRQLFMKNMPPSALDSPFARQQKILMYILPGVFAISGFWFPLGVLIYWLVTNLFSSVQQAVVIQRMPAPGSPADKALQERQARKAARKSGEAGAGSPPSGATRFRKGQRGSNGGAVTTSSANASPAAGASGNGAPTDVVSAKAAQAGRRPASPPRNGARVAPAAATAAATPGGPVGQRAQPKRGTRSGRKRT